MLRLSADADADADYDVPFATFEGSHWVPSQLAVPTIMEAIGTWAVTDGGPAVGRSPVKGRPPSRLRPGHADGYRPRSSIGLPSASASTHAHTHTSGAT